METVFRITLLAVGIVNAYPIVAAVFPTMLSSLYGIEINDANLLVLLRHRAVMLGIVGGLLIIAAFDARLYTLAVVAGLVSMLTYVLIAWQVGGYNASIGRIGVIDIVAIIALVIAYLLYRLS
jgi:hypothetical protein